MRRWWPGVTLGAIAAAAASCASPPAPRASSIFDAQAGVPVSSIEALADALASARTVYVGESHTNPEHHAVQLRVLQELAARRPHLLVGMEMFERPQQAALDRYTSGAIDEETFLRESRWFERWGADWSLYAPLLRFARERGLRVVALNAEREIVRAVGKGGLASLPPEQRARVAADIDLGVEDHRRAIFEAFGAHPDSPPDDQARFQRFYEAQCTWDETMAESAARALQEDGRPDAVLVVFAGSMHIQGFHAIPERAKRRNGLPYLAVLPWEEDRDLPVGAPGPRPADFLWETGPEEPRGRLGVAFKGGTSTVDTVAKGGAAEKVGLAAGDVVLSLDGAPVRDLVDFRLALDGAKPGRVVRLRLRSGDAERDVEATLAVPAVPGASK